MNIIGLNVRSVLTMWPCLKKKPTKILLILRKLYDWFFCIVLCFRSYLVFLLNWGLFLLSHPWGGYAPTITTVV